MANHMLENWLKDAYGMEQASTEMIERFIKDFDDYPDIKQRFEEHLEETKKQAEEIKGCLEKLGSDVSGAKSVLGKMMGAIQGMSTSAYKDEPVKDLIMFHASEHFEHASYEALAQGARTLGQEEIASMCDGIARDEQATAQWAMQALTGIVSTFITSRQ